MDPTRGKMFVFNDKQQDHLHPDVPLKNDTNAGSLPPLISTVMTDLKHYIDNLLQTLGKS